MKGDRHTLVLVGHLVEALILHQCGHLQIRQLPLEQIVQIDISCPVNLKHSRSEQGKVSNKLGSVQIQCGFLYLSSHTQTNGIFPDKKNSLQTLTYTKHNRKTMHYICQTHLDPGGYFSSERYLSTGLIIQPIEQVLQQTSSQPLYLFLVPQHQIVIVLTAELHPGDSCAGQHLQLPHDQRNVLLTLAGKQRK